MTQMAKAELTYYLDRLKHFYNAHKLASAMNVTYATVRRWYNFETYPSGKYRSKFEEVFDDLIDRLNAGSRLDKMISEVLTEQGAPIPEPQAILRAKRDVLYEELEDILSSGKPVRSTAVFRRTDKLGFSQIAVHQAAKKMGVTKVRKGFGKDSYSLWSLPR